VEGTTTRADTPGAAASPHPNGALAVHERILAGSSAEARQIELRSGRCVHVIEAGDGATVLFLHGSGTSSLSLLPVLERLEGVRAIAVDRPGFGVSDPVQVPRERFRDAAIEFVDELLDGLKLETCALAGQSMGGTWGIWYALARPDRVRRLALLSSAPLLPQTRPPAPLRMMVTPVIGDLLAHAKPNAKMVVRLMSSFGEADTIVRYPALIEALVAAGRDPIASAANLAELRAIISPIGFRRSVRIHTDELCRLTVPTLLIWGDRDPVGAVEAAQASAAAIPDSQLEVLHGGHVPYLGNAERASELVSEFVRAGSNG
jgi:pimeloyl-ACP methyl ester carboxylesterase